ncbi:threonine synthase [Saitoella coloradoensis]
MESSRSQQYRSTRGGSKGFTFEAAVLKGLADDSGLFLPHAIPALPSDWRSAWAHFSFQELAFNVLSLYISPSEIPADDLKDLVHRSYATFRDSEVTPLRHLRKKDNLYLLELFHGPTFAFKDVALQFLGNLFEYFLKRKNQGKSDADRHKITVVGATSGDTGSAAIYGLRNKEDVSVFILHPRGRVSPIQEAQMTTVLDANVHNIAVEGTFDDCQDIVKQLFGDADFNSKYNLGAINSINWARILAQIVYYFHSYFTLLRSLGLPPTSPEAEKIQLRYVVPTGNFGDILAGYYAKSMGLPVSKLIVATNANDILDRFFKSGRYEKKEAPAGHEADGQLPQAADGAAAAPDGAKETLSPAMDILVSSNFERLLWYLAGQAETEGGEEGAQKAGEILAGWMNELKTNGRFAVSDRVLEAGRRDFGSERVSDEQTLETIQAFYAGEPGENPYILDPHTAVGIAAAIRTSSPESYTISLSTAHPAKFSAAVDTALKKFPGYNFDQVLPEEFKGLLEKEKRIEYVQRADINLVKEVIERLA